MPSAGLQIFGSGMRLQAVTPGLQDVGNFHISGVGIAETRLSTTTNANGNEFIGHGIPAQSAGYSNSNNVFIGAQINTGTGLAGPFVALGSVLRASGQGCVAMGLSCQAGIATSNGLPNWAIGYQCTAGSAAGSNSNSLAMGYQCIAEGGQNIAIGKTVTCNTTNTGAEDAIGFGSLITVGVTGTRNLLLGHSISPLGHNNVLSIGWYDATVGNYPATGIGAIDNAILIGNPSQTSVQIGPYTITNGFTVALCTMVSSVTVANTVAETSIVGAVNGSLTIPAGRLKVGSVVRIRMRGVIADTLTPTGQFRVKIGGTTFCDLGAVAIPALAGTHGWVLDAEITVRTTGAPGSAIGNAIGFISAVNQPDLDATAVGTTAIDTTIANAIDITFQWGTANAANTLTSTQCTMEIVGP